MLEHMYIQSTSSCHRCSILSNSVMGWSEALKSSNAQTLRRLSSHVAHERSGLNRERTNLQSAIWDYAAIMYLLAGSRVYWSSNEWQTVQILPWDYTGSEAWQPLSQSCYIGWRACSIRSCMRIIRRFLVSRDAITAISLWSTVFEEAHELFSKAIGPPFIFCHGRCFSYLCMLYFICRSVGGGPCLY